ncbi:MAG: hypothetical protein JWP01_173 [Myxococcales bacterium]|nr:hypothetical protein [Myxococcales bacterium]
MPDALQCVQRDLMAALAECDSSKELAPRVVAALGDGPGCAATTTCCASTTLRASLRGAVGLSA